MNKKNERKTSKLAVLTLSNYKVKELTELSKVYANVHGHTAQLLQLMRLSATGILSSQQGVPNFIWSGVSRANLPCYF